MKTQKTSTYRLPGQRPEDGPEPLPQGPAKRCRACGNTHVRTDDEEHKILKPPRACTPSSRIRRGFLWLLKCSIPGEHLHEECTGCGHRWLTLFAEVRDGQ